MSERLWGILVDSFGKILLPGLTVTIPLTAISFTLALIIAVAVALVQFAHVPVLQRLARFYIWVIRGTPVLVQLFVVFYGLPGRRHPDRAVPRGGARLFHQRGRVLRRDHPRRAGIRAQRPDGGRAVRRHELLTDHPPHHPAAGAAHGLPHAGQYADRHGQGYLAGREHHRDRNVHDDPAHCGPHL